MATPFHHTRLRIYRLPDGKDTPRLEDGILITGCDEVWRTEAHTDTHRHWRLEDATYWTSKNTSGKTTLGRLSKVQSGGCDSDWHTPVWKTVS
ncbi:MAG: hypothetical protein IKP37_10300 [Paludibacteraceae bacterium]|nr:hypothetical protein [Paludibacteraceae bacterium]